MQTNATTPRLHPTQVVAAGFIVLILAGALVLMLPIASASGESSDFLPSLFTATSAVSLTGLTVEDTATHWSAFGQVAIVVLIQLGGFGVMSLTSLASMMLTGRLSLRSQLNTLAEGRTQDASGVRRTLIMTLTFMAGTEILVAVLLALRFWLGYDYGLGKAAWYGIFHSVSAFNNAGFSIYSDNLISLATDAVVILPIAFALIVGGLGFQVLLEIFQKAQRRIINPRNCSDNVRFSVTTTVTLWGTLILLVSGWIWYAFFEWKNTLTSLSLPHRMLVSFFGSATARTAGFNAVDYNDLHPSTLMGTDILMFIGGGSGGTAGGIRITTAAIILAAMITEFRGEKSVSINRRTLSPSTIRRALTVVSFGVALVVTAIVVIRTVDPHFTADQVVLETLSAFSTVGLSTGITPYLSGASQCILIAIMYLGRIGPITLVTAMALKKVTRRFEYPEERPFIG
ncbi:TrkH family potassium uptake protein [uncultured Corynebacterium sp.]|uniref:TrkH family potassium uptake protein n=1 Tax=uncultured Corynebacterium sp. TaxID=159447 RepID=UPI0025F870EE|nr:potassium transporter TrkG [uncultured Corynebacterium sp.]